MKKTGLLTVFIAFVMALSGCSKGNISKPVESVRTDMGSVEITVVTSYGGDDGNRQNYEKALKAYEASTDNIVKDFSEVSGEEWKARVKNSFEDGTEPDVLFFFTGADSDGFIKDGKVVSIEDIRAEYPGYASNMKDNMIAQSSVDGKSYAVPVNGFWEGLFANKKVLADCGVDIPGPETTWEEFLADCQKIADKGYIPIAASLKEIPHYWFEFCVLNNGSVEEHLGLPHSSGDAHGQKWAAGLNDIKELYERGFFPDNTISVSAAETDKLMTENKAAFMIEGSWKMGWFAENAADINDFTVTFVPGKGDRAATDIIGGISMGYFITRKAWDNPEKRDACVEFVMAMTSDEVVATFGATAITALKNGVDTPADANSLVKDALKMTNAHTDIAAAVGDSLPANARSSLFSSISEVATGKITAEEAIDRCLAIEG